MSTSGKRNISSDSTSVVISHSKRVKEGNEWVTVTHYSSSVKTASLKAKELKNSELKARALKAKAFKDRSLEEAAGKGWKGLPEKGAAARHPKNLSKASLANNADAGMSRRPGSKLPISTGKVSNFGKPPSKGSGSSDAPDSSPVSRKVVNVKPLAGEGEPQMLIRTTGEQTQVVILEGNSLVEHYVDRPDQRSLIGNIYIGVVRTVVPALEAAFVDIGDGSQGILRRSQEGVSQLEAGDRIVVRVVKDAHGSKGPKLKAGISLTGKYLVILPDAVNKVGVSRRLSPASREKLSKRLRLLKPSNLGLIARSAAEHASIKGLSLDLARLVRQWEELTNIKLSKGPAPRVIYTEPSLPTFATREHFTSKFKQLLVDDPNVYNDLVAYLQEVDPQLVSKVKIYYDNKVGLFERYHIGKQLKMALNRDVALPSGGHIVIDRTEALTAIDVNTGRFSGSDSYRDAIFHTNMEAALEAARQIRLRDIGGIIVIDFIDMEDLVHQQQVVHTFAATMAKDRTTVDIYSAMDELGLVQLSRKRRSQSLLEVFSQSCGRCFGRGVLLDVDAAVFGILPDDD